MACKIKLWPKLSVSVLNFLLETSKLLPVLLVPYRQIQVFIKSEFEVPVYSEKINLPVPYFVLGLFSS